MDHPARQALQAQGAPDRELAIEVPRGAERYERAKQARSWAYRYAGIGWPVTPSCQGHHEWCFASDRHPSGPNWQAELTTEPAELDRLWELRPTAYGVITGTGPGRGATALRVTGPTWAQVLAALTAADIDAPVMRLAAAHHRGPECLYVLTAPQNQLLPAGQWGDRIAVHPPERALPLPAATRGGHAQWAAAPTPEQALPPARKVLAALTPLYLT
jgi:hypothetical protein